MELHLKRIAKVLTNPAAYSYTIGHLYVDGEYFCDTLEPYDRMLTPETPLTKIHSCKEAGRTAIPTGSYPIDFKTWSYAFGRDPFLLATCSGYVPRLIDVPGYEGILIHQGNTWKDTKGCILVGMNRTKGAVLDSRETFIRLYRVIKSAAMDGDQVTITITRTY